MGIARRFGELYAAKVEAVRDRVSDPGGLAGFSCAGLQDLLTEVHCGAARVAAGRERAGRRVSELRQAADRLSGQAGRAVGAGREDLAWLALARRAAILAGVWAVREEPAALPGRGAEAADGRAAAAGEGRGVRRAQGKRSRPPARRRGRGRASPRRWRGSPVRWPTRARPRAAPKTRRPG